METDNLEDVHVVLLDVRTDEQKDAGESPTLAFILQGSDDDPDNPSQGYLQWRDQPRVEVRPSDIFNLGRQADHIVGTNEDAKANQALAALVDLLGGLENVDVIAVDQEEVTVPGTGKDQ